MEKDIEVFKNNSFGEVRVAEVNGEPIFCLADVAKALGYSNPAKAVIDHCKGVTVLETPTKGGLQPIKFGKESEVYRLSMKSNLPSAEQFQDWICEEVLPAIRKTGQYKTSESVGKEDKKMEIKEKELRIEEAKLYWEMSKSGKFLPKYSQVLGVYAANSLSGNNTIPLPVLEKKRYKAGDIAKLLGTSGKKIGMIAKANNLKTEEYGEWVEDKSRFSNKQTPNFEYYENVIPVFKNLLNC